MRRLGFNHQECIVNFPRPYPSDLTDIQWAAIEPLIPPAASGGRRRHVKMREVVNAIRYLEATGCGWRGLPDSFPNRSTVWHYFSKWRRHDLWATLTRAAQLLQEAADDSELESIP